MAHSDVSEICLESVAGVLDEAHDRLAICHDFVADGI